MATKILSLMVFTIALILLGLTLQWVEAASVTRYVEACPVFGLCPSSVDYGAFTLTASDYLRGLAYVGKIGTLSVRLGIGLAVLSVLYSIGLVMFSLYPSNVDPAQGIIDPKQGY